MVSCKIPHNTIALAFVRDMTNDAMFCISQKDQFRGRRFSRIIWLKTPTIDAMNIARASLSDDSNFGWACNKPDMFLGK